MDSVQCWISSCFADSSIHGCLIHHKPVALPTASFRFHLAMDTLAVQLEISTATLSRVFHPLAMNHASHTKEGAAGYRLRPDDAQHLEERGNVTLKVLPPPSLESRATAAFMTMAACLTIESPRPVPPVEREWEVSTL